MITSVYDSDIIVRTTELVNRFNRRCRFDLNFFRAISPERAEMHAISAEIKERWPEAQLSAARMAGLGYAIQIGADAETQIHRLILRLAINILTEEKPTAIYAHLVFYFDALTDILNQMETIA
jgi:hypothetical protein